MDKPRGSWSGGSEHSKTALAHDIRYGSGLLKQESGGWPDYFVVSSPSAYKAARPYLAQEPRGVEYARLLDWTHLQNIADKAADGVELIVGIGGGIVLDASKYVALKKEVPLVLVPTIVSTGAIIHSIFAKWDGHSTVGPSSIWPWIDFDHVIVDTDLVLQAPYYLNTAGIGDILCSYSGFSEWRRNARLGIGEPFDTSALAATSEHFHQIVTEFPKTLNAAGDLTADSVRFIMQAVQERDGKSIRHPAAITADHALWLSAEEVNNRSWIHGEFVAFATAVIVWHCEDDIETFTGWLDSCKVRWRPSQIGVSREELRKALEYVPTYLSDATRGNDISSILRSEPITGSRFNALWEFLEKA
jgi:glycerol dehydrogenase-like iron-containing ADH family enzyme